ncbi:MAG: N-6 DNA methylase [Bacteroidales bacterium]|nr:N-6 DNA methylase [Bacteroidales bacterium]
MEIKIKDNKIYAPLKDKWLVLKPEEEVRQKYIARLVESYGYSYDQMEQEMQVTNSQRGQGAARADIVIWKNAKDKVEKKYPLIVVECKAESISIRKEDYYQGMNYASWAHADFFVTTNLKETRIFKVVKGQIPDSLDEIADIPTAAKANDQKEIDKLLKQTKSFTRDEFSKLLFKCHNIIRNNDKLSPEAAFDEISKILFIKIRYERSNSDAQIFSAERFASLKKNREDYNKEMNIKDDKPFYQHLFDLTKEEFANDHLFDDNAKIEIRENSFEQIVKELEIYNLSTTSDDVKGIAFEQFLGKTFRGELGQFFTPRTIVDFMVSVLDPQEGEYICDPCCGSGGFLIKAFEYVREKIEKDVERHKNLIKETHYTDEYEKMSNKEKQEVEANVSKAFACINEELNINNEKGRLRSLSFDCIYGTDANPRMARTAKMNMIMHGDGHGGVHHHDGLLNVNGIFENRFDVILTNPPFGSRVEKELKITEADKFTDESKITSYIDRYGFEYTKALRQVNDNIGKPLLSLYKIDSGLTEVLFIERCLNLLKPGGRMGIVLPEGVLNTSNMQKVREFVESKAKILLIVSIPQDVFMASGAKVKPSLLFFKKFTEEEKAMYNSIEKEANDTVKMKYNSELSEIDRSLSLRGKDAPTKEEKNELKARKKKLEEQIAIEVRQIIKEEFDYEIAIAKVEKAGINTVGAVIENELIPLENEFHSYRQENKLWDTPVKDTSYELLTNGNIYRIRIADNIASEPEIFYGIK